MPNQIVKVRVWNIVIVPSLSVVMGLGFHPEKISASNNVSSLLNIKRCKHAQGYEEMRTGGPSSRWIQGSLRIIYTSIQELEDLSIKLIWAMKFVSDCKPLISVCDWYDVNSCIVQLSDYARSDGLTKTALWLYCTNRYWQANHGQKCRIILLSRQLNPPNWTSWWWNNSSFG